MYIHNPEALLLILQSCSLTVTFSLALMLAFAWFHQPDTSREYEQMRWCNIAALLIMVLHYFLQIHFGFRAQGADVGAVINTLFYPPATYIVSYSFVRLAGRRSYQHRFLLVASISMLFIIGSFVAGYIYYGSLHMPLALSAMGTCFFLSIIFCYFYPRREIERMQKFADDESGNKQVQYSLFLNTSSRLLYGAALAMSLSIYFTPLVFIVGLLNLAAILFFVTSFVALGFNIGNVNQIISTEMEEDVPATSTATTADSEPNKEDTLTDEQKDRILALLTGWRQQQGYGVSDLNSTTLASRLNLPKRQLVQYLREVEGKTFRVWLSDLRLEEAKRLIKAHPEYSNESIAEACGFSRSHLQAKFKESTGMTTKDWRTAHAVKSVPIYPQSE